ncbi:transposase (plasmid) [Agrobacterium fabrum]|nr:transposase [Agrobacterium fabrum]
MIFPSNRVRIMVATKPVDFRKGHDGLAALVKNELRKDAVIGRMRIEGALFLRQPGRSCSPTMRRHASWILRV